MTSAHGSFGLCVLRPHVALVVVCVALGRAPFADAQARLAPTDPLPPAELEAFVDGVVHTVMTSAHIAGAAVSVVQAGRVMLNKGYGFADVAARRRVDADRTLFRIGSITKTFTWLALLKAIDEGRLSIEDAVNARLPESLHIPDEGFSEPIRLRHLMTHTAGFEDRMFGHTFVDDPGKVRPLTRYLQEERPRRVREPGAAISYSNYGAALAGAILEHVHGRAWQDVIEAEILRPAGMRTTSAREPYPRRADLPAPMDEAAAALLSRGYRWTGARHDVRGFEHITQIAPAGAISSTAGDMARYMLMLLGGGRIGDVEVLPDAVGRLESPATSLPPPIGNWKAGFLEWSLPGGFRAIGHDGGSLLFFSEMALVPELALGVFVTTNTAGGDVLSESLAGRIVERFYAPPGHERALEPQEADGSLEGFYLQTRRAYGGLEGFLYRLMARQVVVDGNGYLETNLIGARQQYVSGEASDLFVATSAEGLQGIRFVREGGVPVRIDTPFMAFERVGFLQQPPVLALLVGLTLLVSAGTLARSRARFRRDVSRARQERRAAVLQTVTAAAWLIAAAGFAWFGMEMLADTGTLFYGWPHPGLMMFSALSLLAAALALAMTALVPAIWRTPAGGWSFARRISYTVITALFVACGAMLLAWGALPVPD